MLIGDLPLPFDDSKYKMENVEENAMWGAFANLSSSVAEHTIKQLSRPRRIGLATST